MTWFCPKGDVNKQNFCGLTPLHYASSRKDMWELEDFVRDMRDSVSVPNFQYLLQNQHQIDQARHARILADQARFAPSVAVGPPVLNSLAEDLPDDDDEEYHGILERVDGAGGGEYGAIRLTVHSCYYAVALICSLV